jgi:hypothetical protein
MGGLKYFLYGNFKVMLICGPETFSPKVSRLSELLSPAPRYRRGIGAAGVLADRPTDAI